MDVGMLFAVAIIIVAGIIMGSGGWPIKLMKTFKYEHWAFIAMLVGLIIGPWAVTLAFCPNAIAAYKTVPLSVLIKSNLFSLSWGIANVLCLLCFVRIGFSLTCGIMTGIGVSLGVTLPMIFKGTGLFANAPGIMSSAGTIVLLGVLFMLIGVVLASLAGFGRDKALKKDQSQSGNFLAGLVMVGLSGVLSCGISFSFVYSQGPIVDAMKANGASDVAANFAVWAVGLMGGALINVLYPAMLITRNKSWRVVGGAWKELLLASLIGINFIVSLAMMGKGMLMLGALGASVGFGIQQAMQMMGGQAVGFISGEWKGVNGKPRLQIYLAITALIVAALIMAWGNSFTNK